MCNYGLHNEDQPSIGFRAIIRGHKTYEEGKTRDRKNLSEPTQTFNISHALETAFDEQKKRARESQVSFLQFECSRKLCVTCDLTPRAAAAS
jgi:hypothetical protein